MSFDNTWAALLKPGRAESYFQGPPRAAFEPSARAYRPANAWWLAELARLIYRQESDELGAAGQTPGRDALLRGAGLRERAFFNRASAQGALVETLPGASPAFAALVFRGSLDLADWLANLQAFPLAWPGGGRVHAGFMAALDGVWEDIAAKLAALRAPVFYTGHSLGAALATLAAARRPPAALYTFGSPRVGDRAFARALEGVPAYRVVNHCDVVPTLPPGGPPAAFTHVGELRYIAHDNRMCVAPPERRALADWLKNDPALAASTDARRWYDPPEFLADHAPVNYVAHLALQLAVAENGA